jgi:hypothetical protein
VRAGNKIRAQWANTHYLNGIRALLFGTLFADLMWYKELQHWRYRCLCRVVIIKFPFSKAEQCLSRNPFEVISSLR